MTPPASTVRNGKFVSPSYGRLAFGAGCVHDVAAALDAAGVSRSIVITGPSLAREGTMLDRLMKVLGPRAAGVFSQTIAHNPREVTLAAARCARDLRADALISFGGSTQNEAAKGAAWTLARGIDRTAAFDAYDADAGRGKAGAAPADSTLPIFAIPTTLSAGEFTAIVGITDGATRHKKLYSDPHIASRAVFLDPELTLATPEWLWLSTGMKAIDHCVEAYLSNRSQPFTDALAGQALAMLFAALPACRRDPRDLSARLECQIAAWMSVSGLANVHLGLSHGMGHQLGSVSRVPHGYTSCVMLQHVLGYNRAGAPDRQAQLADLLDLDAGPSIEARADAFRHAILHLVRDTLQLPWRLRDVGVEVQDLPAIAELTLRDPIIMGSRRMPECADEILQLLKDAW